MTDAVITDDLILPTERGGWWHEYVCPAHGTELLHDGMVTGRFPEGGARCPYGCRLDTPAIRGAWTVLAHQACATRLRELAHSGDPAEREAVLGLLSEYAELYAGTGQLHDGSQPWMLRGRLFHQALTEAVWAVNIGRAAWALNDHGVRLDDSVTGLLDALAAAAGQARDTLIEQGKSTSNYVAWLDAAGAVCSRDEAWLTGDHGIYAHVLAASLPDGWQWEASTYYHSFVLRACQFAIAGVPGAKPPAEVADRLAAMRRVLLELRSPNGDLPALHDGPYRRDGYDAELADLELSDDAAVADPISVHRDGGYAILRRPGLQAVVAFGPHGGSHGHLDKLTLSLYGRQTAWQVDPGQVPYGHRYWRAHYASTAAHATFSIDGDDQAECAGTLLASDDTSVTTGCDAAYPGVTATRTLRLTDTGLVDQLTVRCDRPRRIALHLRPAVHCEIEATGHGFATNWHGNSEALTGRHESSGPAQVITRPGPGPADDPQRSVLHLDWVAEDCTEITFTSSYGGVDHDSDR